MKLQRISILALPGITPGFELAELDPGINLIVGPNASGKTSLCRAVRALLYQEEEPGDRVHLEAEFIHEDRCIRVVRIGRDLHFNHEGKPVAPPSLPDYRFVRCYTIEMEDLISTGETEQAIVQWISRELAGGYDLNKVVESALFKIKTTHGREEAKKLREAESRLRKLQGEHLKLREDESHLDELEDAKAAAEEAARRLQAVERALELLKARRRCRSLERVLKENFPPGMERLAGNELEQLERLKARLGEAEENRQKAEEKLNQAQKALESSRLKGEKLAKNDINEQRRLVERLAQLEVELEHLGRNLRQAELRLSQAKEALGGKPGSISPKLDPETVHAVEEALVRKRKLDARKLSLREELARLGSPKEFDLERLQAGRRELLQWLSAPKVIPGPVDQRLWLGLIGISSFLAIIGATLAHPLWILLLFPLTFGFYKLLLAGPGPQLRQVAVQRFQKTGCEPPERWNERAVRARLEEMDRQIAEAEAALLQNQRRREAENSLAELEKEITAVCNQLRELANQVGFDPTRLDASFDRWVRIVAQYDEAAAEVARLNAEKDKALEDAQHLRETIVSFLQRFEEAPTISLPAAEDLRDRLEALETRLTTRDQALRDIEVAKTAKARAQKEYGRIVREIEDLFRQVGLESGAEGELKRRVARYPKWKELQKRLLEARGAARSAEAALKDWPDLLSLVDQESEEALEKELEELREKANQRDTFAEQITRIKTLINRARRSYAVEEARAARQTAEDALRERLNEHLLAEAGSFLIEEVRREHVEVGLPSVLTGAQEWFRRFTRYQYELRFEPDGQGEFYALDTRTGEYRSLAELSTGTRMQLFLAVRLAFLQEAERGRASLPLFLDEALTTADPERFQAIVEGIEQLVYEGNRQVFYLTAQPLDAELWARFAGREPHRIDLAEVRDLTTAITDPAAFELPALDTPHVPEPTDYTPEAYGALIGVPPIDPHAGVNAVHLFHILRDDLELLHRLLELGVTYLGELSSFLKGSVAKEFLSREEIENLTWRLEAVRAWIEAWRRGRARPLDRAVIESSPAISERFKGEIAELAEEMNWDARALIDAIEAGNVRYFRARTRERLYEWLVEQGYLVEEEPLSPSEVEHHVLSKLLAYIKTGKVNTDKVRALVRCLQAGVSLKA